MIKYNLLFDVSNMFHRSFHVYKNQVKDFDLSNVEHRKMMVRKFIRDSMAIVKLVDVSNLYFCFDSNSSFRKTVNSTYKANREKKEWFDKTMNDIYKLLEFKGFNVVQVNGLEADDCIALVCERLRHLSNIIISQDDDLKQLVSDGIFVLTPNLKNRTLYKSPDCCNIPPIKGVEYADMQTQYILTEKLLKGCEGDNVSGLAPKGYRMKKVNEIADTYLSNKINFVDSELNYFKKSLSLSDLEISDQQLLQQLRLVCLKSEFMPEELVNQFKQIIFKDQRSLEFTFESILSNTIYFE